MLSTGAPSAGRSRWSSAHAHWSRQSCWRSRPRCLPVCIQHSAWAAPRRPWRYARSRQALRLSAAAQRVASLVIDPLELVGVALGEPGVVDDDRVLVVRILSLGAPVERAGNDARV